MKYDNRVLGAFFLIFYFYLESYRTQVMKNIPPSVQISQVVLEFCLFSGIETAVETNTLEAIYLIIFNAMKNEMTDYCCS